MCYKNEKNTILEKLITTTVGFTTERTFNNFHASL